MAKIKLRKRFAGRYIVLGWVVPETLEPLFIERDSRGWWTNCPGVGLWSYKRDLVEVIQYRIDHPQDFYEEDRLIKKGD